MNISLCLIPFLALTCYAFNADEAWFSRDSICDVETRLINKCSKMISNNVRSVVECLTHCSKNNDCTGASVAHKNQCFIHKTCPVAETCFSESADHNYFSKNCLNKGRWIPETKSCKCVDGWVGKRCHELPKSCNDLIRHGYSSAPYTVTLDLSSKDLPNINVVCYIRSSEPTFSLIYLMKNAGRSDQRKTWSLYRDGFDFGASHMWSGLHEWHVLSEAGYNTLTVLAYFYVPNLMQTEWHYHDFKVLGESENYAFHFGSAVNETIGDDNVEESMGDCFGPLQGVPFSTWDQDHDDQPENCAEFKGSGWWFKDCNGPCHLLGWGEGYKNFVPPQRLISIAGMDMNVFRSKLVYVEMHLKTPDEF